MIPDYPDSRTPAERARQISARDDSLSAAPYVILIAAIVYVLVAISAFIIERLGHILVPVIPTVSVTDVMMTTLVFIVAISFGRALVRGTVVLVTNVSRWQSGMPTIKHVPHKHVAPVWVYSAFVFELCGTFWTLESVHSAANWMPVPSAGNFILTSIVLVALLGLRSLLPKMSAYTPEAR